jgi:hypothetical protein
MQCIAFLRCASVAFGLGIPLAAGAESPTPYPLGRELREPASNPERLEPTGVVRLSDALAAALIGNPELAAEAYEVRAREAALVQSHAHPNPTLSIDLEGHAAALLPIYGIAPDL